MSWVGLDFSFIYLSALLSGIVLTNLMSKAALSFLKAISLFFGGVDVVRWRQRCYRRQLLRCLLEASFIKTLLSETATLLLV